MMGGEKGCVEGQGPWRVGGGGPVTTMSGRRMELGDLFAAMMEAKGDSGGGVGKGKR